MIEEGKDRFLTLDEELSTIAANCATALVDEELQKSLFSHFQHFLVEKELQENLAAFKNKLERGVSALLSRGEAFSRKNPSFPQKELISAICRLIVFLLRIPKQIAAYEKMLECNITPKEACKISDNVILNFFEIAKSYQKEGAFEEASDCFGILTFLDPAQEKFWIGFANAEYSCRRFDNAFLGYSMASYTNPFNPALYLFSCKTLEALSDFENIMNAAVLTCSLDTEYPEAKLLQKVMRVAKERLLYIVLEEKAHHG
jgi:tetratricopeptide (TPR) repeat protein